MNEDISAYKRFSERMRGSRASMEKAASQPGVPIAGGGRLRPGLETGALGPS